MKKHNKGFGILDTICSAIILCGIVFFAWQWHHENIESYNTETVNLEYLSPTAGITYYMVRLEYHCMEAAKIQKDENEVQTVSQPESVEDDIIPFTGVEDLFGYVPEDWEWEYLYRAVKVESGYLEPDNGVMAVIYVIANRCRSKQFPNTIYEVLSQPNQFETWSNGNIQNCNYVEDYFIDIVSDVIAEDPYPEYHDLLFFTAGQYNPYCEPVFVIGHHYFGR